MIKKYIFLTVFFLISVLLSVHAQEKDNKILFYFNELNTPLSISHNNIKVQKFGAFLKLNATGRINENGKIIPIDIIFSLPKFDYETPNKHTYKNSNNNSIDPSKDASMTVKIGDDTYSTFYRSRTGDGNNTRSQTTNYTMVVYNNIESNVPMVNIAILPGSFLSTSVSGDSELKRLTFSPSQQFFEIINPYPEGLKPTSSN